MVAGLLIDSPMLHSVLHNVIFKFFFIKNEIPQLDFLSRRSIFNETILETPGSDMVIP